jgi:hypothetical protein
MEWMQEHGVDAVRTENGVDEGTWSGCSNNKCMQELLYQQKEKEALQEEIC